MQKYAQYLLTFVGQKGDYHLIAHNISCKGQPYLITILKNGISFRWLNLVELCMYQQISRTSRYISPIPLDGMKGRLFIFQFFSIKNKKKKKNYNSYSSLKFLIICSFSSMLVKKIWLIMVSKVLALKVPWLKILLFSSGSNKFLLKYN